MIQLSLFASFICAYIGFCCWALSQTQHWRAVVGGRLPPESTVKLQRFFGGNMVALSFIFALLSEGLSFGALVWILLLSVAATAVACTLVWSPRLLRFISKGLPPYDFKNTLNTAKKS